jgi:hypothetical protein
MGKQQVLRCAQDDNFNKSVYATCLEALSAGFLPGGRLTVLCDEVFSGHKGYRQKKEKDIHTPS